MLLIEIPAFCANSIDPDQTPRSLASDLGLHCLPMFFLWDARHKWVKIETCKVLVMLKISATYRY